MRAEAAQAGVSSPACEMLPDAFKSAGYLVSAARGPATIARATQNVRGRAARGASDAIAPSSARAHPPVGVVTSPWDTCGAGRSATRNKPLAR